VLGLTGLTAVGQIAKIKGATAVGIAGGPKSSRQTRVRRA